MNIVKKPRKTKEENGKITYWFTTFSCQHSDGRTIYGNIYVKSDSECLSLKQLIDNLRNKHGGKILITFLHKISKESFDELLNNN